MPTSDQNRWIVRVLGVTLPSATLVPGGVVGEIWQEASTLLDTRLAALSAELRSYDDVDLTKLANKGVHQLLDSSETTSLAAAILAYDKAAPALKAEAASGLRKAMGAYQGYLDRNGLVDAIDDNPFEVEVEIYTTLNGALRRIDAALGAVG